mmetsp:Transcript_32516/g.69244  ORF Transcript_32516/g.69244 Transcript_32516/m.69244 type:complete len:215 (+) Transcript_32516:248-892(+)
MSVGSANCASAFSTTKRSRSPSPCMPSSSPVSWQPIPSSKENTNPESSHSTMGACGVSLQVTLSAATLLNDSAAAGSCNSGSHAPPGGIAAGCSRGALGSTARPASLSSPDWEQAHSAGGGKRSSGMEKLRSRGAGMGYKRGALGGATALPAPDCLGSVPCGWELLCRIPMAWSSATSDPGAAELSRLPWLLATSPMSPQARPAWRYKSNYIQR